MIKETAAGSAETKPELPTNEEASVEQMFREDNTLASYLERVLRYRAEVEKAEAEMSEARRTLTIAETDLITQMAEHGIDNFKSLGKTIVRQESIYPRFNKADEEQAFEWLREIGQGAAIKSTVHPQTFGAIVREMLEEAKDEKTSCRLYPPPSELPEFIKVFREWKLYIRQGSAK